MIISSSCLIQAWVLGKAVMRKMSCCSPNGSFWTPPAECQSKPLEGTQPVPYEALTLGFPATHFLGPLSMASIKPYACAWKTPAAVTPSAEANVVVFFCIAYAHGAIHFFLSVLTWVFNLLSVNSFLLTSGSTWCQCSLDVNQKVSECVCGYFVCKMSSLHFWNGT